MASNLKLPNCVFAGSMPPSAMPSLYDQNDILINGSFVDNAPSSIIEAFSCGLPVVSTDAGGIPYLVRHESTGLLCERGDWKALAENVIRLIRDQTLAKKMVENGREAARKHDWNLLRSEWLALYRTLDGQAAGIDAESGTLDPAEKKQNHCS
jgi:glycosyltransferase involved in cell wall biosynthesis